MGTPVALRTGLPFRQMVGVGGIGTGLLFALEGAQTLGRNESRSARLLNVRDRCKLHIISHYVAVLLGAGSVASGFRVVPLGKVGNDERGRNLLCEMAEAGMDTSYVTYVEDQPTLMSVCLQYPDGSGGNLTTGESAASELSPADLDSCAPQLFSRAPSIALAVPEVPLETRAQLLTLARDAGAFCAASFVSAEMPTAAEAGLFSKVDLLAMNEDEASMLTGETFDPRTPHRLLDTCTQLLAARQPGIKIVLSAGSHGAFAFADGAWHHRPALKLAVANAAGAGDALLAGVLAGMAAGLPFSLPDTFQTASPDSPLQTAFDLGVLLATFSVTSPHTIHPDASLGTLLAFAAERGIDCSAITPCLRSLVE